MTAIEPRLSMEEIARRGIGIFERAVRPSLRSEDESGFVAIDIKTGEYAIDADSYEAISQLRARNPSAEVWLMRCDGSPAIRMRSRR